MKYAQHLLPSFGWEPIDASDCRLLDLSPMERWEGFYVEWLGRGALLAVRPAKSKNNGV